MADVTTYVETVYLRAKARLVDAVNDYKKEVPGIEELMTSTPDGGEELLHQAGVLVELLQMRNATGASRTLEVAVREFRIVKGALRMVSDLSAGLDLFKDFQCMNPNVQRREGFTPAVPGSRHEVWKQGYDVGYELASFHCEGSGPNGPQDPAVNPYPAP